MPEIPKNIPKDEVEGTQRRFIPLEQTNIEVRQDGNKSIIEGYAAVFNQETEIGGFFREMIRPGAFKRSIDNGTDVVALFNHDPNFPIGRRSNSKLIIEEDSTGLFYRVETAGTQWENDLIQKIDRQDIQGNSFSFEPIREEWTAGQDKELDLRELMEVRPYDLGPVTFPAYTQTSVDARNQNFYRAKQKTGIDLEQLMQVLVRSEQNHLISTTDTEFITTTIAQLREMVTDPSQGRHSLAIQRELRQLEMLEIELQGDNYA